MQKALWQRFDNYLIIVLFLFINSVLFSQAAYSESENVQKVPDTNKTKIVDDSKDDKKIGDKAHEALFAKNRFPSATQCQTCHQRQYQQWSVSQHAYAQLSPVFLSMHNTINRETSGTNGDFCIRCHTPIGMTLGDSIYASNLKRKEIVREGVTCVTCHRQRHDYGKISSRVALEEGDLTKIIYGPTGNTELKNVLEKHKEKLKLVTRPTEKGRKIHRDVKRFFALITPKFCGTCHDVTLINAFRLEEAFSAYLHSPASKRNVTCQDCHMGKIPGSVSGYDKGPAATIGEYKTKTRKLTNHYFAGPDYPIIHPGIFPINPDAHELATIEEWLKFNVKAGWGTDRFEDHVSEHAVFPEPWDSVDARYDAREILDEQFKLLKWARKQRQVLLQRGYQLGGIEIGKMTPKGIRFRIEVKNGTDGHNAPTGFIAERVVFLQVTVTDKRGNVVYKSGDRDPNGDIRDLHSSYVHAGQLKRDKDLFNLQSRFILRNNRGGEQESVLAINRSFDPRPFLRPATFSSVLTGSPTNVRIQRRGIPPGKSRWANYHISRRNLHGHDGPYHVKVKLIAQMVPANLITRIQDVGFDFHMSAKQIANLIIKHAHVVDTRKFTIVKKD